MALAKSTKAPSLGVEIGSVTSKAGESPAQIAVTLGNENTLRCFMESGLDINSVDQNGESLLMLALKNHRLSIASYLVEAGTNLNLKCKSNGGTALHMAVELSNEKFIESMILAGADINAQDSRGNTSLHLACRIGSSSIACMLIHFGADVRISNLYLETPLHEACKREMFQVIELMCSRECPINEPNKVGNTPLHVAAKNGSMDILRLLLLSGSDIDLFNKDGMRAEELALVQGHTEASELLSKLGNSIATDKLFPLLEQLNNKRHPVDSIKIKIFGRNGSGKSTLIDSMKCGFFWRFFRKIYSGLTTEENSNKIDDTKWIEAPSESYTKGINVHKCDVSGVGKVSLWEFSGFEPYLAYYDFFIGDPSCIHLITFDVSGETAVVKKQLFFWLDFIRTRIAFHEPIGFGGTQLWPPHVVFVATHADEGKCSKDDEGNFVMEAWESILSEIRTNFERDLIVLPNLHVLDAHQVDSVGMKMLKSTIQKLKHFLTDCLGKNMGLLSPMLSELPTWINKLKGTCPVVTWLNFIKYIRGKINPLVLESHVVELVNEMQILGEVVYLPKTCSDEEDLIILNPKWLATDILGQMLSYETIRSFSSITGQLNQEELSALFPDIEFSDLENILHRLEFCLKTRDSDGQSVYYFPTLDFSSAPLNVWEGWSLNKFDTIRLSESNGCSAEIDPKSNDLWQGMRISSSPERDILDNQIKVLYPRIARALLTSFAHENGCPVFVKKVTHWATGITIEAEGFSTIICLSQGHVDVVTRGRRLTEKLMFEFSDYCINVITFKISQACPGISLQKYVISSKGLKASDDSNAVNCNLRCYNAKEILESILSHKKLCGNSLDTEVVKDQDSSLASECADPIREKLIDLIAFGSKDVLTGITFGTDVHVSKLHIHARFALAQLLDMEESPSNENEGLLEKREFDKVNGWKELAKSLNVGSSKACNSIEQENKVGMMPISKTDEVLTLWSVHKEATIGMLAEGLARIKRLDAREVILRLSPIFVTSELLLSDTKL